MAAQPQWFAMKRPNDPIDEVEDAWEARVRCHRCDKSYVAQEMDRDPTGRPPGDLRRLRHRARGPRRGPQGGARGAGRGGEREPMTVELNCDMGESFGLWRMGDDAELMPLISMANVACGFHAGDPVVMRNTVALAKEHGVRVGAHPAFPDLQGFGRRAMTMDAAELTASILYQAGALKAFLDAEDMPLTHLKPHGALYGRAATDEATAHAVADAAELLGVPVLGMAGTLHETVYAGRGVGFLAEYYADLDYADDGSLLITREHVAYDPDEVRERVARVLADGDRRQRSRDARSRCARTACASTPTPRAPRTLARAVRAALDAASPSQPE